MRNAAWRGAALATGVACSAVSATAKNAPPPARSAAQQALPISQIHLSFEVSRLPDPAPRLVAGTQRLAPVDPGQPRAAYLQWLDGRTRLRGDRTRIAFYPIRGSGLHVSGGSQLHPGYQTSSIARDNRDTLRLDPRRQNGPVALSAGYDRTAPVALIGYDRRLSDRWTLGVDAGAMRGRTVSVDAFTATGTNVSAGFDDLRSRLNPVADVTLSFVF